MGIAFWLYYAAHSILKNLLDDSAFLPKTSKSSEAGAVDALSEVLKIVKLRGALSFNAEFSAPWCLASSQSSQVAPLLCAGASDVIIYHYLRDGHAHGQLRHAAICG
ncbi:MAG: cupin domain-containing protein [Acidobacteriaceae bacterium]|nr:cupin domain-containing protein [Acidobacteriaceae bacterium]